MLKLSHVSKTFNPGSVNEKKPLQDLSLEVADGDFITIIGANGAGKSTLFKSILGQMPHGGMITFSPAGGPAIRLSDGAVVTVHLLLYHVCNRFARLSDEFSRNFCTSAQFLLLKYALFALFKKRKAQDSSIRFVTF